MTGKDLFREVGNISEKYITEAEETKRSIIHNVAFRRTLGTAACLVLCVGVIAVTRIGEKSASTQAGDSSPQYECSSDGAANMMESENSINGINKEEQSAATNTGNSSWEDFWEDKRENEKTESSIQDSVPDNAPEEIVGNEPEAEKRRC